MGAIIATAAAWATATLGPHLVWAAPFLARVPALSTVKTWLKVGTYVAALGLGAYGGAKLLSAYRGEQITLREADARGKTQCNAAIAEAAVKARTDALDQRERWIEARVNEVDAAEAAVQAYAKQLEADREKSVGDDAAVLGIDDKWLRAWANKR